MKRTTTILFLILFVLPVIAAPKKIEQRHFVNIWGGAGYSSMLHQIPDTKVPGGFGAELGVGYEYDRKNLLMQTGLELQYLSSKTHIGQPFLVQQDFLYTPIDNHLITYNYNFTDFTDTQHAMFLNIPLLMGYRFKENWYFMAGVRLGFGVMGRSKTKAIAEVSFTDAEFSEDVINAGHYTGTFSTSCKSPIKLGFNLAPSVEIGAYLDKWINKQSKEQTQSQSKKKKSRYMPPSYRLSAFAEFNALNVNRCITEGGILDMEKMQKPDDIYVHALLNSENAKDVAVHNLLAGVKFTYMFSLDKAPRKKSTGKPGTTKPKKPATPTQKPEPEKPQPVQADTIRYGDIEVEKEQPIVLDNLLFEFSTANIIETSKSSLEMLLNMMQVHTQVRIEIIGHTDNMGSDSFNQRLSEQRAEAVRDYLVGNGISADRIATSGRGATQPIDTNLTDEGRQKNRRVEFVIVE